MRIYLVIYCLLILSKTWLVLIPAYIDNNAHSNKLQNQKSKYLYLSVIGKLSWGVQEMKILINKVYST